MVELRDRLAKFTQSLPTPDTFTLGQDPDAANTNTFVPVNDVKEEAVSALVALGYKPPQASKMVNSVFDDGMSSEALIRQALKASL